MNKNVASPGNLEGSPNWRVAGASGDAIYKDVCKICGAKRIDNQLGLEKTPEEYVENTVKWAREVWRVLRKDGTFWLNLGDSYSGSGRGADGKYANEELSNDSLAVKLDWSISNLKPKDLCGIPWKVVFALQADGWWLRSAMPWVKRSAMPESCTDRPASALEYMFLLTKSQKYYFDMDAIRQKNAPGGKARIESSPGTGSGMSIGTNGERYARLNNVGTEANGRNFRNTDLFYQSLGEPHGAIFCGDEMVGLDVNPQAYKDAHFATFPEWLVTPLIKAGTSEKGACPECGAPWGRIIEKPDMAQRPTRAKGSKMETDAVHINNNWQGIPKSAGQKYQDWRSENPDKTIGWQPTCKCYPPLHELLPEPVPCVVLDPFGGSGTTKNVADRLGRRGVILELKMEYIEMAKKRCRQEPGLF